MARKAPLKYSDEERRLYNNGLKLKGWVSKLTELIPNIEDREALLSISKDYVKSVAVSEPYNTVIAACVLLIKR